MRHGNNHDSMGLARQFVRTDGEELDPRKRDEHGARMSNNSPRGRSLQALVFFMGVTWLMASLGILSSQNAPLLYRTIVKPSWAPPAAVFGPVWSVLYCLMAIAAWLVWRQRGQLRVHGCIWAYVIHLAFQAAWSWLFFGLGRADVAMIDLALLWIMIVWLMLVFWRCDRRAGILMIPYFLWVSFAAVLNGSLWLLNGGVLLR
jgi:tryptophan-rich sensory protein